MQIVFIPGTDYSSAPSWLPGALAQAGAFLAKVFTDNVTINVTVNWVQTAPGFIASNNLNGTPGTVVSFAALSAALAARAQTQTQSRAYATLPTSGVTSVYVAPGEADVLGLASTAVAINLNLGSTVNWSRSDIFGAIVHEITEGAMGRTSRAGDAVLTAMDMFRYSAPGVHDLTLGDATSNTTAYYSTDGGTTVEGVWNNDGTIKYDRGDWVASGHPEAGDPAGDPIANDAFGPQLGGVAPISETDLQLMRILGWDTTIVTYGDTLSVGSGVTSSGLTVMDEGQSMVASGGVMVGAWYTDAQGFRSGVIGPGVFSGGWADDTIESGGVEQSATIATDATQFVDSGGEADATLALDYGEIYDAGVTSGALLSGGDEEIVRHGVSISATVFADGVIGVEAGGLASATAVESGGVIALYTGGVVSGGLVSSGGELLLDGLHLASGESVLVGQHGAGTEYGVRLASGALLDTSGVVVSAGAIETVDALGYGGGDVLRGGHQHVAEGGFAYGTLVSSGGLELVFASGLAEVDTVRSGGVVEVLGGGEAQSARVSAGGELAVSSGGVASNTRLVGGRQDVAGGSATDTVVASGGLDVIQAQGLGSGAVVLAGGVERVAAGGDAISDTISSGGVLSVMQGAVDDGARVLAGGALALAGWAVWSGGGTAVLAGELTGGGELIADGPGALVVSAAAAGFDGELEIDGGVAELAASLGAGEVVFGDDTARRTLQLAAGLQPASGTTFSTVLAGFDSSTTYLDLAGVAFVSGAAATISGDALTLVDGAYTASFVLGGAAADRYAVFSDGAGGTEVRAAIGATQTPLLAHAIAAFDPAAAAHPASPASAGAMGLSLLVGPLAGRHDALA